MTPPPTSGRPRAGWTFAIVSVALFMTALDNLVVSTALPTIRTDLGASLESLEWTVNAYTLSFAVLLLTGSGLLIETFTHLSLAITQSQLVALGTLVVFGAQSDSPGLEFAQRIRQGEVRRGVRVAPGCGHLAPMEQPDEIARMALEFFNED